MPLLVSLISVFLSSPKLFLISSSSEIIKAFNVSLSSSIFCSSIILLIISLNSLLKLSCSKPVNLPSLNSRIALACSLESLYFFPEIPASFEIPDGLQASLPTFFKIASTGPAFQTFLHKASAAIFGSFDFLII